LPWVRLDFDAKHTGSSGEIAKKRLDQGFDMVSICTDTGSLVKECTAQVQITLGQ
jgi:hypothetical protein